MIIGLSVLEPGRIGDEYAMTRGHIHANHEYSELLLRGQRRRDAAGDHRRRQRGRRTAGQGRAVYVPGHWVHRSVNVGDDRFVTLFCYGSVAGRDYGIIERAGA